MVSCRVGHDLDHRVTVVQLSGLLNEHSVHQVRSAVIKAVVECPHAVVADLTGLVDQTATGVSTLGVLDSSAVQDYAVRLLWVAPNGGALRKRLQHPYWRRRLEVYETRQQALTAALGVPPPPHVVRRRLPPCPDAPEQACLMVHQACVDWRLAKLVGAAGRIMTELAANAVIHAGTEIEAVIQWRGRHLYLSVRDNSPDFPRLLPYRPETPQQHGGAGTGLRWINQWATAWGSLQRDPGKVVWATLRIPPYQFTPPATSTG